MRKQDSAYWLWFLILKRIEKKKYLLLTSIKSIKLPISFLVIFKEFDELDPKCGMLKMIDFLVNT